MYNEEETIGTVVTMVSRHVDLVICVDDGSSDASARIAEANGAMVLRHRVNRRLWRCFENSIPQSKGIGC